MGKVFETNGLQAIDNDKIAVGCVNSNVLQMVNINNQKVLHYNTVGETFTIATFN